MHILKYGSSHADNASDTEGVGSGGGSGLLLEMRAHAYVAVTKCATIRHSAGLVLSHANMTRNQCRLRTKKHSGMA